MAVIIDTDAEKGKENPECEGVIGSLTFLTISTNFKPETDKAVVKQCPISFEFSKSRTLHCRGLSQSKNKHKPVAISDDTDATCMWKDSGTYGLFSKSGLGANRFNDAICSSRICWELGYQLEYVRSDQSLVMFGYWQLWFIYWNCCM